MDDTDRKLILHLCENPRMPVKDLAKRLGISRQAANFRLQNLTKAGLLRSIKAEISASRLNGVFVWIWGKSRATTLDEVLDSLGDSEFTTGAIVAGGNELLVTGFLRGINDLSEFVEFVRHAAEMHELTVGLPCYHDGINPDHFDGISAKGSSKRLSPLDLRIIAALRDSVRKPASAIARSMGISTRTVRRHLEAMKNDGSMDYYIPLDIPPGEDMYTLIFVTLKNKDDAVRTAKRLLRIDPVHLQFLRRFSNLPSILAGTISSNKMSDIRKILNRVEQDDAVLSVTPNLLYSERRYSQWDYRLVQESAGSCRESNGTS